MTVTPERITDDITVNASTVVGPDVHSITLSDGSFIVAYVTSDADATAGNEIVAQQFDAIGNKIGGEMILASTTSTNNALQFDIVALENNKIAFGFENFGDIQVDAFTIANGVATADPALSQTINTPGSTLLDVALSGDSLATLKLHYAERTGGTNVVVEQRDVSGGVFTAQSTFASPGGDADIEIDSDTLANGNTVFIVDRDGPGGGSTFDLFVTRPDGTQVVTQIEDGFASLTEPRVTALKNGGFVVGFQNNDGDKDVLFRVFNDDGTERAFVQVFESTPDENDDPEIVALDDGGFVALIDRDDGNGALIGGRFDSDGNPVGNAYAYLQRRSARHHRRHRQ